MTNSVASCQLICLQKTHDAIQLPDGETVVVGRSPQTKIIDPKCSRNQLEITADWKHRSIRVKQNGSNPSAIDGKDIGQDCTVTVGCDSTLFILSHLYPHRVVFQVQPNQSCSADTKVNKSNVKKSEIQKVGEDKKKVISNSPSTTTEKQGKIQKEASSGKDTDSLLKDSKARSSSKRQSTETHEEQLTKKKRKTESNVQTKVSDTRNGDNKVHESSKQTSSNAKENKFVSPSRSKIIERADRNSHRGHDVMEFNDDDEHVASIEAKLNKMKQAALETSIVGSKTSHKETEKLSSHASSASPQSSSSSMKASSESSSRSHKKTSSSLSTITSDKNSWDYFQDHYVFTSKGVAPSSKIAGFDLDGTIIVTKSGKTFPEGADDWRIYLPEIFHKLKDLHTNKFKIVFFTNQLGVARGKTKIDDLMKKIENVVAKLQVPIQVFIATHEGRCRKPNTGMWEKLVSHYNGGVGIDLKASFYVGDAAGRQANWAPKRKKDFSCSDRLFAINIGITFKTPEEFFQNQKPTSLFKMPEFDPRKLSSDAKLLSGDSKLISDSKETVILVGFPASGKSHFATNVLAPKGYKVINRDTLGTWQKCVQRAQEELVNSSVVIDNTNLSKDERRRYIECAKKANVPCRCFIFTTTVEHCRHNERFRQMTTKSHEKINEMIFNKTKKSFEEPSMTEGFTEIVNVNFVPHFSSDSDAADYMKFLLEK